MKERFSRILETCTPYFVSSPLGAIPYPGEAPLGIEVAEEHRYDPHKVASGDFLHALQRLDELTFGPVGMTMPRWVFYDCAEVPGGIFGFGRPAAELPDWVRRGLDVPVDYVGLVPLSMYVAIPMLEAGAWHTYTLCTINEVAPGAAPTNLGVLTEAAALSIFQVKLAYGATQWRSRKLKVHSRFGPLELLTAWTPAHSDPSTTTFRFPVEPARIEAALAMDDHPRPSGEDIEWIDCDDREALVALQTRLEAGERFELLSGAVSEGDVSRVPIRAMAPGPGGAA
ncbi:MAG: hypothetical protein P1V51_12605 [Deltaproteobacteria bacterium]|nr:hypothetical protein [Deltaproteobacteria bacterium]